MVLRLTDSARIPTSGRGDLMCAGTVKFQLQLQPCEGPNGLDFQDSICTRLAVNADSGYELKGGY